MPRESFAIGSVRVRAGSTQDVELPITKLVTGGNANLPVRVIHGREPGPVVGITGVIHGDEVLGVEIIRRVMAGLSPKTFRGTLLAVPVVNVLGFMTGDRYLPDRRDLNRSFPLRPRLAGESDRPSADDRGGQQVRPRHRPAHRCRPAHQPSPDQGGPR